MPRPPLIAALGLTASLVAGAIHLAVDDTPYPPDAAVLLVSGIALLTVIAVTGIVLSRGRWARFACGAVAAAWVGIAAGSGLTPASAALIGVAAVALALAAGPWLSSWLRHLPSADGPPPAAVVALLSLVSAPAAVGIASTDGVPTAAWAFAGWSALLALALGRAVPGSLSAARMLHPAATLAAAMAAGLPSALGIAAAGVAATASSWHRDLAPSAAHRPGRVAVVRIPPELAPPEVLEAAGLDERGRRRDPG